MEQSIILIPAYEPSESLIDLLKSLSKYKTDVIVVNDGSNKEYQNIFKQAKKYAKVIEYNVNRGKGFALKRGLQYIEENYKNDYYIITMDCDGQHTIKDAINLYNYVKQHPNELVLGKRIRSKKTPIRSRLGNAITRTIYNITTGLDVYDTQTGLRAFSNKLVEYMLSIEGERFEYEMNVLLNCPKNAIKIKEIEIETIYIDNNSHSHFKFVRDSILVYKEIFKFISSSIICFIIDYIIFSITIIISNKLILSNIIARILSATLNFTINKHLVFKNKNKKYFYQIIRYTFLAISILVLNTTMLIIFVKYFKLNQFISKIIIEIILFLSSWIVQKKIIFNKEK